ncbi:hypothetical protein K431DRAFT_301630 [Polychaeton citri CBS 116435]|uniref:Uncharacterized protein n=1 Tax=Polychaeton citri CBS 116435 TaxID=1314669 RepID=A0A9P4QD84_9PEZI|nr:hypothetical protein K431DRAFT_301630 [Polychaeton citri CBS 116435]
MGTHRNTRLNSDNNSDDILLGSEWFPATIPKEDWSFSRSALVDGDEETTMETSIVSSKIELPALSSLRNRISTSFDSALSAANRKVEELLEAAHSQLSAPISAKEEGFTRAEVIEDMGNQCKDQRLKSMALRNGDAGKRCDGVFEEVIGLLGNTAYPRNARKRSPTPETLDLQPQRTGECSQQAINKTSSSRIPEPAGDGKPRSMRVHLSSQVHAQALPSPATDDQGGRKTSAWHLHLAVGGELRW